MRSIRTRLETLEGRQASRSHPFVIRMSDPPMPAEIETQRRYNTAGVRYAVMPYKAKSTAEWVGRFGRSQTG